MQGGTGADDGMAPGGPIRNVQSMHTFYPQPGPSGPPQGSHGQDGARPHSWDNSNANAQLNNLQNLLGSQQILQQIASLNQQQVQRMSTFKLCAATYVHPSVTRNAQQLHQKTDWTCTGREVLVTSPVLHRECTTARARLVTATPSTTCQPQTWRPSSGPATWTPCRGLTTPCRSVV